MTYIKPTCNKTKACTAAFWISALLLSAYFTPMFIIPIVLLAMFNSAYLMLTRVPVPIVLSFVGMVSLSLYTVYINTPTFS